VCERLAQVITRQCGGRELNQRHVDHTEILPLAYSTQLQKWSRRYRSCRLEYIMWPSMKVCTHYHFQQFDMSRFVFRLLIQSGVGMAPWKNRTSRYISFFSAHHSMVFYFRYSVYWWKGSVRFYFKILLVKY